MDIAPAFVTPPRAASETMTVSLVSSAGAIRLRLNSEGYGYKLHSSVEGLGVGTVDNTLTPKATGGAILRHQRMVEGEIFLPIIVRSPSGPAIRDMVHDLTRVLMVADGTCEVIVYDPYTGEGRRQRIAYKSGLGTPEWKGPNNVKYGITCDVPDPTWYGPVRETVRALDGVRRPFLAAPIGKDSTQGGKIVRRNLFSNPSYEAGSTQNDLGALSNGASATVGVSDEWSASGTHSVKISNEAATGNDTSMYIYSGAAAAAAAAAAAWGFSPGKTFTMGATLHIPKPLTGVAGTQARRFNLNNLPTSGGTQWGYAVSDQAPNEAGTYRLTCTFTVPEDTRGMTIRLMLGHNRPDSGSDVVYWDNLTLEEGSTDGSYFDGDTPTTDDFTYEWEGEPHKSPSVMKARQMYSPRFFPVILAQSTVEGAFTFTINGDAPAWPTWIVDGPGEDLLIENKKTGDRIFVSGRFDEQVTITTRPQVQDITSPSHMDGSLWDRVAVDSVLFPLAPGRNEVAITMVGASAKTQVQMTYQEAWKAGY